MKKSLLITMGMVPAMAFAQSKFVQVAPQISTAEPVENARALTDLSRVTNANVVTPPYFAGKMANPRYSFVEVGVTYYDLQTNASVGRRVYLHADGTVSVTWTTAPDGQQGFPQRGSGYNYFDGSTWAKGGDNKTRVENFRSGWPSIGILPDGKEYIIGHDAELGGFRIAKNSAKGNSDWTTGGGILKYANNQRPIWNRTVNSGNYMHTLSNFSDSTAAGDPRVLSLNGVRGPMTYSRSTDGGSTWDKQHILLPGYDSTRIVGGGGDNYSIDVRGNSVAIVTGGLGDDISLWVSNDNGDNFTKIIVDSFPYAPFNGRTLTVNPVTQEIDTPFTNDGTVDVLFDNNGSLHVFWGLGRVMNDDSTDDTYSFFPATAGIVHWSQATGTSQIIGGVVDEDGNNTLNIEPGTWSALSNGQIPNNVSSVARNGNTSLVNQPCAGIDASGNIFVSYSAPRERDLNIDQLNFRDVYIVASKDGGVNWTDPQNITQEQQLEDAFPSIARKVDNFVHLVWQQDDIPGTNLQNNATGGSNHPVNVNRIMYAAIPVSDILSDSIGQGPGVGIHETNLNPARILQVSQNFPNPFNNNTSLIISMNESSPLTLTVTNLLGQVVIQKDLGDFNPGTHQLVIDGSNLSAGMYTYTISTGASSISNKMMVK